MQELLDRLTAAFLGHTDHVDRELFGSARDAIKAQAAEIGATEAKLREAVALLCTYKDEDATIRAFLSTMETRDE